MGRPGTHLSGAVFHAPLFYFARWPGPVFENHFASHNIALSAQDLASGEDGDEFVSVADLVLEAGEDGGFAEYRDGTWRTDGNCVAACEREHVELG
jgi:hypothetical protein